MPLNSQHLSKDVQDYLRELPQDKECVDEIYYQTKIEIYEQHCNGCGFARIILTSSDMRGRSKVRVFDGPSAIADANVVIGERRCDVARTCTYPNDMSAKNNKEEHPTLNEIVSNTCQFWNMDKLNIPPDSETSFIEVEEIQIKPLENEQVARENINIERISTV